MKNPLLKRLPREIKSQWKKYMVLFLMLTITIGFVSGMYVANGSMLTAIKESYTKYNIEDGHFNLKDKPTEELLGLFEEKGIKTYKQYYKDFNEDYDLDGQKDAKIRVFRLRDDVNGICVMEGTLPQNEDEIVIDRMHADNSGIKVGDTIAMGKYKMKVTGLVAFSDYSTLYEKSTDLMFDALTFDIAAVTDEAYERLRGIESYQYAFIYNDRPQNEMEQKEKGDKLVKELAVIAATGGLLDDADKAKELETLADEAEILEDDADALEKEGDALKADGEALESEVKALEDEGRSLESKGQKLKAKGEALQSDMMAFMGQIAPLLLSSGTVSESDLALLGASDNIPPEIIALLPADMQSELAAFADRRAALEGEAAKLQEDADALSQKGEELKVRGDELTEKKDDLESRADVLKARGDELEEKFKALSDKVESLDDLEKFEDNANELTDFVPEYLNQAIHFAPSDMGSDKAMGEVLLIILVVVLAFIFAITASNTINTEAAVIGTLRASGYTRSELMIHYMTVPVFVTVIAAITGNILGYTCFKNVVVGMYYNSYSLSTYVTIWNAEGFVKTTVYPVIIMIAVCAVTIYRKLRISPLRFLRHDLSTSKRKRAVRLPGFSFFNRFRLRILFQNIPDYFVMFLGILFVTIMLTFCVGMPSTLNNYKKEVRNYVVAEYQYILKGNEDKDGNEIKTSEPSAEKYSISTLKTIDGVHVDEDITVYGYVDGSTFIKLPADAADNEVYVSTAYADKFKLTEQESITLKEKYSDKQYDFVVKGIYDMPGAVAILMPNENFNKVFDLEEGTFTGFLSHNEIDDIDPDMTASVITLDDSLKIVNQLDHSIGGYIEYFSYVCMVLAMLLTYLLTKLIIEKNAVSISMVKVLGYNNGEINRLYVYLTSLVVVISAVVTSFLSIFVVRLAWSAIMNKMNGWFIFNIGPSQIIRVIIMVIAAYIIVSFLDVRRIKSVPLTEALKNVE